MTRVELVTQRLVLRAAAADELRAAIAGRAALETRCGAKVAEDWPPEHLDAASLRWMLDHIERDARFASGWGMWWAMLRSPHAACLTLIGNAGFTGPPDGQGSVECGYAIVGSHQRRGHATEMMRSLLAWAFGCAQVRRVSAQTFPHLEASLGVMRKLGMRHAGPGSEAGAVRYEVERA